MKFSTIVLALATIVAAAPSAAAEYVCHTEAILTYASEATPSISTKAKEFLGSVMVDTFNEAYATPHDIPLDAEVTIDFVTGRKLRHGSSGGGRCGPLCDNDDDSRMLNSEVVPADVRMLRHGSSNGGHCGPFCDNDDDSRMLSSSEVADVTDDARKLRHGSSGGGRCGPLCDNDDDSRMLSSEVVPADGARKLRRGWGGWSNGVRCPLCVNDDDSRMLSSEVVPRDRKLWTNASHGSGSFTDEFGAPKEHMAWEKLFLEKGRTHTELADLKGATIVLSDCRIE